MKLLKNQALHLTMAKTVRSLVLDNDKMSIVNILNGEVCRFATYHCFNPLVLCLLLLSFWPGLTMNGFAIVHCSLSCLVLSFRQRPHIFSHILYSYWFRSMETNFKRIIVSSQHTNTIN